MWYKEKEGETDVYNLVRTWSSIARLGMTLPQVDMMCLETMLREHVLWFV